MTCMLRLLAMIDQVEARIDSSGRVADGRRLRADYDSLSLTSTVGGKDGYVLCRKSSPITKKWLLVTRSLLGAWNLNRLVISDGDSTEQRDM